MENIKCINGKYIVGEYSIAGNDEDGYTVWKTADGEDSDTLYGDEDVTLEECVEWCKRHS